jgi:ferredoxin
VNASTKVVTFTPLGRRVAARDDETLLDLARTAGVPLANSCGAIGICGRCRVRVIAGAENLSPPTSVELRFREAHRFAPDERMACQAVVSGKCEVTTGYW